MPPTPPDPARRQVLARTRDAAAAGVVLAVFAPVSGAATAPAAAPAAPARRAEPLGYHETERIRRYYELARF